MTDPPSQGAPTAPGEATASPQQPQPQTVDLVAKFQKPVALLLLKFGDDLLDIVANAKGIDVNDVRAKVLGPVRVALMRP